MTRPICRHENAIGYMWRENIGPSKIVEPHRWMWAFTQPGQVGHHHKIVCQDCGAWLPLGPSKDDGEHAAAIAVEIRAAELAVIVDERRVPGRLQFLSDYGFDGAEIAGWIECQFDSNKLPEQPGEHAGYLARCILEHSEGG